MKEMAEAFERLIGRVTEENVKGRNRRVSAHLIERVGQLYEQALHLGIRYQKVRVVGDLRGVGTQEEIQYVIDAFPGTVRPMLESVEELRDQLREVVDDMIRRQRKEWGMLGKILPDRVYLWVADTAEDLGIWEEEEPPQENIQITMPSESIEDLTGKLNEVMRNRS
jgi:hypothetical protein